MIVGVDEAGFVGARQAKELMEVGGDLRARGVQVKLHLLGDTKQMQAIAPEPPANSVNFSGPHWRSSLR